MSDAAVSTMPFPVEGNRHAYSVGAMVPASTFMYGSTLIDETCMTRLVSLGTHPAGIQTYLQSNGLQQETGGRCCRPVSLALTTTCLRVHPTNDAFSNPADDAYHAISTQPFARLVDHLLTPRNKNVLHLGQIRLSWLLNSKLLVDVLPPRRGEGGKKQRGNKLKESRGVAFPFGANPDPSGTCYQVRFGA